MRFLAPWMVLAALALPAYAEEPADPPPVSVTLEAVSLAAETAARLEFAVAKPLKVNEKAPRRVRVGERRLRPGPGPLPVEFQVGPADVHHGVVEVEADYYVCEDRPDAPCFRRVVLFQVPVAPEAPARPSLLFRTPEIP